MPRLRIEQPDRPAWEVELNKPAFRIGRVKTSDLVIAGDSAVSREHCRLDVTPEGVFVTDLGSYNGTIVNGGKIGTGRVRLLPGDRIQ
ncbi:MAG: FHA domain-containing protein, partial [Planctomycetota bacterium]|nr:FHA domain-containing protein [Planctomycetota bacterium]